jgi:uncharacterized membrane protein YuzA (DUF378 family)
VRNIKLKRGVKMKKNPLDWIAEILVIIGGLNWGFLGLFNFNLVETIFGSSISTIIYDIVGLAALYMIYLLFKK